MFRDAERQLIAFPRGACERGKNSTKERIMKFLDVKTDFAFKKVFGSEGSKDILISFLNALVTFPDGEIIEDLTIVDPYQIPLLKGMKDSYVDVKARLSNKTSVIIEMQVLNVEGFEQRILYNAAKSYSSQLVKGKKYYLLNPVIAITITDFDMFKDIADFKTVFRLLEKQHLIEYSGDIELIFIELPKFEKTETELVDIIDKWIFFVKNSGSLEYIPETLSQSPEIVHAFQIANEAGLTPEEHEAQWKRLDFIMLQQGSIEYAEKIGMAKGMAKGKAEERLENARKMKQIGVATDIVMQFTGLSREEIEAA
jgi:predicted transposase/invertase (TIGR01784 family)